MRIAGTSGTEARTPSIRFSLAANKVRMRAEGVTERLGDLFLTCTRTTEASRYGPFFFNVFVYLNTSIPSRLMKRDDGDPPSCHSILFGVATPQATTFVRGIMLHSNCILFSSVRVDDMKQGESRSFQMTGIYANANALQAPGPVVATIAVSGAPVENDTQIVGIIESGLEFELRSADASEKVNRGSVAVQSKTLDRQKIATLRFTERFP